MPTKLLSTEIVEEGIISVTINNHKKKNALSEKIKVELCNLAEEISSNPEIAVIILSGDKGNFSSGNDITESTSFSRGKTLIEARRHNRLGLRMCNAWTSIPQITIAAMEGVCVGGGLSLALSCDFRICSPTASFWAPEVELGITYSWGTIPKLVAIAGPSRAKLIALACKKLDAKTFLEWGLCEAIHVNPYVASLKMAKELSKKPKIPQQMVKESINREYTALKDFSIYEQDQVLLNLASKETQNILKKVKKKIKSRSKIIKD